MLDSSNKKTIFLHHVILSLNIENVKIVTKRIEEFSFAPGFARIITRATTAADIIVDKAKYLCADNGQILIMKGKYPTKELEAITKKTEVHHIKVPYLNEERHLVRVVNGAWIAAGFSRASGSIAQGKI